MNRIQFSFAQLGKLSAKVVLAVLCVLCALPVLFVVLGLALSFFEIIDYDNRDPEYSYWQSELEGRALSLSELGTAEPLDFKSLRGGDWEKVCALGGYNNPIKVAEENGAFVSSENREKLEAKLAGFRISIVEEFEFMFVIVKSTGQTEFIHFFEGIGPAGQHFKKCIKKPITVLKFFGD